MTVSNSQYFRVPLTKAGEMVAAILDLKVWHCKRTQNGGIPTFNMTFMPVSPSSDVLWVSQELTVNQTWGKQKELLNNEGEGIPLFLVF